MARYVAGRLLGAVVVLWAIITLSFVLMRFAPGGPFDAERRLSPGVEANKWLVYGMGEEVVAPIGGRVASLGQVQPGGEYPEGTTLLTIGDPSGRQTTVVMPRSGQLVSLAVAVGDTVEAGQRIAVVPRSLLSQYLTALGRYATLDFGVTFSSDGQRTVSEQLLTGLPISAELGFWALMVALLLGVPAGLFAGLRRNTLVDYGTMAASTVGLSIPPIVSGPLLLLVFVTWLGWLPFGGWETWQHKLLPVATLSLVYVATFARLSRAGVLEVIRSDYIRTARAKGLSEPRVVLVHALKGAILPTVTWLGPATARILTGSLVVERVFGIPGLSESFITPALYRDYPMVIGVVVVYSALLVVMNLLVDITYTSLDPRVRLQR